MSRNVIRGFQTSTAAAIQQIGAELMQNPRIVAADIQGAKAHISSKDTSDPEEVITVGLQTQGGLRVGTLHIHLSGSFKFFASRAGYLAGEDDPWAKASPAKK
ncbi:hypothetical protein BO94DRAFT_620324 [Aspergillus sclerotioniger CBS 115572]|uniref:Uncharacterized protein n=1 Tax=Aspergillus sclerotioniger CBS 115572 TaxID=1450535 RepID=A0A317XCB3_9EURO|nr:hypothetical protein BO94DRAFT_620324 [Aspergillus sclerotioniger CBS 115572]PWY95975.1 hypothetical protein BO94DRAFT_620324 [Aspergillus sclerotioniger CBS 115572]